MDQATVQLYTEAVNARIKKVLTPGNGVNQSGKKRLSRNEVIGRNTQSLKTHQPMPQETPFTSLPPAFTQARPASGSHNSRRVVTQTGSAFAHTTANFNTLQASNPRALPQAALIPKTTPKLVVSNKPDQQVQRVSFSKTAKTESLRRTIQSIGRPSVGALQSVPASSVSQSALNAAYLSKVNTGAALSATYATQQTMKNLSNLMKTQPI